MLAAPLLLALAGLGILAFLPTLQVVSTAEADGQRPIILCRDGEGPAKCAELVEMEIKDVVPLHEAQTHAVVLVSKDKGVVLPVFVEENEAVAIAFRLAEQAAPSRSSQDLLDDVVVKLGGHVTEIRIDDVEERIYASRVVIQQGDRTLEMLASAADSIAMAISGKARIYVTRKVLTVGGITRSEIEELQRERGIGGSGPSPEAPPREPEPSNQDIRL